MIDAELQILLDEKQDEILTGMPVPRDGKVGDIRTNVTHKGKFYQMMKVGIDTHLFSAPFSRTPSIHTMDDYLLKSGGKMLDDRRIYFRDTGLSIYSSADGQLDIDADTELEITAPTVDINASTEVNISNNLTVGGDILLSNGNYVGISAAERLEFYTAGYAAFMGCNVGVGTVTADHQLHLHENSSSVSFIKFTNDTTGQAAGDGILVGLESDEAALFWQYENNFMRFGTNNTERMRILAGGNVGRNTATPAAGFHNVGTTRLGDQATNYVTVEADGDVNFVGGAGLQSGEIYVVGNANASVLNSAAKVQFVHFDTDGSSNGNITPAHGQDHITIGVAGRYFIVAHLHIQNNAAQSHVINADVWINNGGTAIPNVHCHHNLTGGLTDVVSMSLSGTVVLPAAATLEMWLNTNSGDDRSITVVDCSLVAIQIGGSP